MSRVRTVIKLTLESTTVDIVKYLQSAENNQDISEIVEDIDAQGKAIFGKGFQLRFDPAVQSKDFRDRVFLTTPIRRLCAEK